MLEKSFALLFYLKSSKIKNATKKYVYCRITVDRKISEFSTKRKCDPAFWNQPSQRMGGLTDEARNLNGYLEIVRNLVDKKKRELTEDYKTITALGLKNAVFGIEARYWLGDICCKYNLAARQLIGVNYTKDTVQRFERVSRYVLEYTKDKYGLNDLELKQLDYEFIKGFSDWLRLSKGMGNNSTKKFCSTFKTIVLDCIKRKLLTSDPFTLFSMRHQEVQVHPLTIVELKNLENKQFYSSRLTKARDVFVFCCYTGLAYADAQRLSYDFIYKDKSGDRTIRIPRKKTSTLCVIPLLPQAKAILYRYGMMYRFRRAKQTLPICSNQKMNLYLGEISNLCDFKHKLTFHTARHTFATTVTLANGVPLETVSKMLGHKSIRQTQHYATIIDSKVIADMSSLNDKLNPKIEEPVRQGLGISFKRIWERLTRSRNSISN